MFSVVYARDIKKLDTSLKLSPDELDCSALTKTTKKKNKFISIAIRQLWHKKTKRMLWHGRKHKTQKTNSFWGSLDHLEDEFWKTSLCISGSTWTVVIEDACISMVKLFSVYVKSELAYVNIPVHSSSISMSILEPICAFSPHTTFLSSNYFSCTLLKAWLPKQCKNSNKATQMKTKYSNNYFLFCMPNLWHHPA